ERRADELSRPRVRAPTPPDRSPHPPPDDIEQPGHRRTLQRDHAAPITGTVEHDTITLTARHQTPRPAVRLAPYRDPDLRPAHTAHPPEHPFRRIPSRAQPGHKRRSTTSSSPSGPLLTGSPQTASRVVGYPCRNTSSAGSR